MVRIAALLLALAAGIASRCLAAESTPAAEVERHLARLQAWFDSNERLRFAATSTERCQGCCGSADPVTLSSSRVRCLRNQGSWKIDRADEFLLSDQDAGTLSTAHGHAEFVLTPERRLHIQFDHHLELDRVIAAMDDGDELRRFDAYLRGTGLSFGQLPCNGQPPLIEVLRDGQSASRLLVADGSVPGATLLESRGKWGRQLVWIDDTSGCPRKIVVHKEADDILGWAEKVSLVGRRGKSNGIYPSGFRKRQTTTFDPIEYRPDEVAPLLTGYRIVDEVEFDEGGRITLTTDVQFSSIERPETFSEADFYPDTPIPEGYKVSVYGLPGIEHAWREGEIVLVRDPDAERKLARLRFTRGFRSPWYVAFVVGVVALLVGLLAHRIVRAARA